MMRRVVRTWALDAAVFADLMSRLEAQARRDEELLSRYAGGVGPVYADPELLRELRELGYTGEDD